MTRATRSLLVFMGLLLATGLADASVLSDKAGSLGPGQSIKLGSVPVAAVQQPGRSESTMQYSDSGAWDSLNGKVWFTGKEGGGYPLVTTVYDVATNRWSLSTAPYGVVSGHGYDHSAADESGNYYFHKPQSGGSSEVKRWNGSSWSTLPPLRYGTTIASALEWVPWLGLVHQSHGASAGIEYYNGSSWVSIQGSVYSTSDYHNVMAVNPASQTVLFGGGNTTNATWEMDSTNTITPGGAAPFNLGASMVQTVLVGDPGSEDHFIAWRKESSDWYQYDVSANQWVSLSKSTGDGSTAQNGTPNLSSNQYRVHVFGVRIDTYNVIMYVQWVSGSTDAEAWLYRHSSSTPPSDPPDDPTGLGAR